jgi:hypothetical protein
MPTAPARLMTAVLLAAASAAVVPAGAAGAGWRPPVGGEVVRAFDLGSDPFEAGRHRGADLAASPGEPVRAPCPGRVAVAGRVGTSGRLVTLLCGRWRVTQMPLATVAVRAGDAVRRGDRLGTVAASRDHAGLHLGVRRDGARFGYVDPLRFLDRERTSPPVAPGRRPPRLPIPGPTPPPRPHPVRLAAAPRPLLRPHPVRPTAVPHPLPRGVASPAVRGSAATPQPPDRGIPAPWPAWIGLAVALAALGMRRRTGPGGRRPARPAAARQARGRPFRHLRAARGP